MNKLFAGTAALALSTIMMGSAAQACGDVSITEMNWASGAIVTEVSKFLMENGYGCTVQVVPSATVTAMTSVAETGKPDILTEIWVNTAPDFERLESEGKILTVSEVLSDGAVEGWWVPKYLTDANPELATIEGVLANPEQVGALFHTCPTGWACEMTNASLAKAFDLEGHGIKTFAPGSAEVLASSIAAAYTDEKPWLGYYFGPTPILGKYPMTRVTLAPIATEPNCNSEPACDNPVKSDYASARVVTVITPALAEREPDIKDLMSKVAFTNDQMNAVLAWQEDNKATANEAAVHFLTTYQDAWADWLSDDAREKLAPLLQ